MITAIAMENEKDVGDYELNRLLPPIGLESSKNLSSSAPGAISDQNCSLIQLNNAMLDESNDSNFDVEVCVKEHVDFSVTQER